MVVIMLPFHKYIVCVRENTAKDSTYFVSFNLLKNPVR